MARIFSIILILVAVIGVIGSFADHGRATTIMQQIYAYIGIFGGMTIIAIASMSMAICSRLDRLIKAQEKATPEAKEHPAQDPEKVEPEALRRSAASGVALSFGTPVSAQQTPPATK